MWPLAFQGIFYFLLGSFFGALLLQCCSPTIKRQKVAEKTAEAARLELMKYRALLTQHVTRSAELLAKMSQDYRQLYDHMLNASSALLSNQPQWLYGTNSFAEQPVLADSLHPPNEATLPLVSSKTTSSPVDYPKRSASQATNSTSSPKASASDAVLTASDEIRKNFLNGRIT